MINTAVLCRIPTNETADETTGPHGSRDTSWPANRKQIDHLRCWIATDYIHLSCLKVRSLPLQSNTKQS